MDPHRSPTMTVCAIPVNGDELQVQTEVMDVCITTNEVKSASVACVVLNYYYYYLTSFLITLA